MAKVYTRKGDDGKTSLVSGHRLTKSNSRIEAYGEVDELNSFIGMFISKSQTLQELHDDSKVLLRIQNKLFDLGSNLACELNLREKYKLPQLRESDVIDLEKRIDILDQDLPKLKNFILPGGHELSALAQVLRTVTRRVERSLIRHELESTEEELPIHSLSFINRLSDYFFVLARYINLRFGIEEIKWTNEL